jgi:amidase
MAESEPDLDFASVAELADLMGNGELTSVDLTRRLIERIRALDSGDAGLHAVIQVNPLALDEAAAADTRRAGGGTAPLLGIPVLVKDNVDTAAPLRTTAGSLALADSFAAQDATLVTALRDAGAVVLGKTNLSEWANYRSSTSTSGWSAVGGLVRNPYDPTRSAGGSSSGSGAAVAAGFAPLAIGTETDGSIVCPASLNGVVGIKPTVGLVSRAGVVPISFSQDTPGPLARSVTDAALLLTALAAPGPDSADAMTSRDGRPETLDYVQYAVPGRLDGVRIGVARSPELADYQRGCADLLDRALGVLSELGAEIVDDVELPGLADAEAPEVTVLDHEFRAGLGEYLTARGGPIRSLGDVIAFNEAHPEELAWFGQEHLIRSDATSGLSDPAYLEARVAAVRAGTTEGIDGALHTHTLDAIVMISYQPAWVSDLVTGDHALGGCSTLAAVAGYPLINVPCGTVPGPNGPLPVGLAIGAGAWSEPMLLRIASAYEAAAGMVCPPPELGR